MESTPSIILPLSAFKGCSHGEAEAFFFFNCFSKTRQSNENGIKGGFREAELKPCPCHFATLCRIESLSASRSSPIRQES